MLYLSFQELSTKIIKLADEITFQMEEAFTPNLRKEIIRQKVLSYVSPESVDEENAWAEAQRIDTEEAYRNYLELYPGGNYCSLAQEVLDDEACWQSITNEKNISRRIELLEAYHTQHTRHIENADDMLGEDLWKKKNYQRYVDLYPEGKYAPQAREKLAKRSGLFENVIEGIADAFSKDKDKEEETAVTTEEEEKAATAETKKETTTVEKAKKEKTVPVKAISPNIPRPSVRPAGLCALQNRTSISRNNFELFALVGRQLQHYWQTAIDGQWHQGMRLGANVESAPAVFQNKGPEALYNYEVFVREGNVLQHYWLNWKDKTWRRGVKAGANVLSAPAVFQNEAPASRYDYEIFVREGNRIQHLTYSWKTKRLARMEQIGVNVQCAPTVFQNMAADARYNYELFFCERNAIQHYWRTPTNTQWRKGGEHGL